MTAPARDAPDALDDARPDAVAHVLVVVPARDEEERLGRCLGAIAAATRRLAHTRPDVSVDVVVVLDACTDRTPDVAARALADWPGHRAVVVTSDVGRVGAARAAGVAAGAAVAASLVPAVPTRHVWVAGTDADSVVPPRWLAAHVGLAEAGADVVVGTVQPDGDLEPAALTRWLGAHDLADGHRHVHGANLGLRLSTYAAAGGFPSLAAHEDVALVAAARALGARTLSTGRARVTTSARAHGRAPDGFAAYLRRLRSALGTEPA